MGFHYGPDTELSNSVFQGIHDLMWEIDNMINNKWYEWNPTGAQRTVNIPAN